MNNLLEETLEVLKENGKQFDDIFWIGTYKYYVDKDRFKELSNTKYDASYGAPEVAQNLMIVGDDWYLERHEYDGSEWWEYKEIPVKPKEKLELNALTIRQAEKNGMDVCCGWETLEKMNIKEWENEDE